MSIPVRILLLLLAATFHKSLMASPQWLWSRGVTSNGTNSCFAYGITTDPAGNVIMTAALQGTVTVGSSTFVSRGSNDILVVKYDPQGMVLWARSGGGSSLDNANCVVTDQAGNIYVSGIYSATAIFGSDTLSGSAYSDIFIIKYDSNGNQQWIRSAGGTGNDYVEDIAVDAAGQIYLAGSFQSLATFGTISISSSGGFDAFLAKYDPQGNTLWVRSGSSTGSDQANSVACDASGNVYMTGYFNLTAVFTGQQITSVGGYDVFWAKYDAAGNLLLLRQAGGTGSDYGQAITVDQRGHAYCTGFFNSSILFGSFMLVASGVDFYIAEYDDAGTLQWVRSYGGSGLDNTYDISLNSNHDLIVCGYFENTLTLGTDVLVATGSRDILLASFDSLGTPQWGKRAGGAAIDYTYSLVIDPNDNIYLDGAFNGPSDFGSDSLTSGSTGAFISRLRTCDAIAVTPPQGFCINSGSTPLTFAATSSNPSYAYTWLPVGLSGNSITFTPSSTTTLTLVAADPGGCVATATTEALVESPAQFSLVASPDTLCSGNTVELFACWNWNNAQPAPVSYCAPNASTNTPDEQIYSVTIGPMVNDQLEDCLQNYHDYTNTIAPIALNRGGTYPFSVRTDECDGAPYYNNGMSISIDYNRDGDWDDNGETVYVTTFNQLAPNIRSGTFTVPATASVGLTRARIVVSESNFSPLPCAAVSYGEVEDYAVEIGSGGVSNDWSVAVQGPSWITQTPGGTSSYTVTSTSQYGCVATASVSVPFIQSPNLSVTYPPSVCVPSAFTLDAGPGYSSYVWTFLGTNIGNSQTLTDTMRYSPSSREYVLQVTSVNGCTATDTLEVIASEEPDPTSVCIVTVDSSSQYNLIVWEKSVLPDAVDSFLVYREITTNNYSQVGAVHRSALSVFTDTNVNVNSTSYRYKIAWRDTCGNMGSLSPYHSTIHLQYLGLGNLQWTSYDVENNPSGLVAGYEIFRDDASTGNFQLLQTVSGTSQTYTDIDFANFPNARYLVDIIPAGGLNCVPTRNFTTSRSNIRRINGTSGIGEIYILNDLSVFPNPADRSITVEIQDIGSGGVIPMEISDVYGRVVKTVEVESGRNLIAIDELASGMYGIRRMDTYRVQRRVTTFIKR